MIAVINPLVRSLSTEANELSWEIENSTEDAWDYTFQLFRSEAEQGPWDQLTETFTDRYYYIDSRIPKYRHSRQLYYKVKIVKRSDSSEAWSDVFSREGPGNKYAEAIIRQERLVFRKFVGQRIIVLPIRTFGFRCTCWDEKTKKRMGGACIQCYNTGFVGGYLNAIETYAQINAEPYKISMAQGREVEPRANNIIMTNYPLVKPYDVIIQPDLNYRWRIAVVSPTRLGGALVHQNLTVGGISQTDIEFKIEIDESDVLQKSRPEQLSKLRTTI